MKDNAFINIICNVALPIFILNKLPKFWPHPNVHFYSLILALSIPLIYGAIDLARNQKINYIALLGLINILLTGSFALMNVKSEWYSYKEALFPFLVGAFVIASSWTSKPFIKTLFLNPQLLHLEKLDERLTQNNNTNEFQRHLKLSNIFLSGSFFLSSLLNYVIARRVFVPIAETLPELERKQVLNDQIASMTAQSFLGIMLPSMIALMLIFWFFLHGTKKLTQLSTEEIFRS